jgi:alpha-beta hydrolase superfamily lysophospholipase
VTPLALPHLIRIYAGLVLLFLGVMQAGVAWCGPRGLSLTRGHRVLGALLGIVLLSGGLVLAATRPLIAVVLSALPAVATAMGLLAALSSWANHDLHPPDARLPGPGDPWTCEHVWFSDGGVRTPALYLQPTQPCGAAVCWVHGTGDEKAHYKWPLARALTGRGIGVLTFDLPGHGEHPHAFSLPGARTAVPSALAYLAARPDVDAARVGIMGVSLGGALLIQALAGAGPGGPRPAAICLLQTPCTLWLAPRLYVREVLGLAALPALAALDDTSLLNLVRHYQSHPRPRLGQPIEWIFDELAPARDIRRLPPVPLLLVYGRRDPIAPPHHGERLYARARGSKEWHLQWGASHLSLIFVDGTAARVGQWFARRLGVPLDGGAGSPQ